MVLFLVRHQAWTILRRYSMENYNWELFSSPFQSFYDIPIALQQQIRKVDEWKYIEMWVFFLSHNSFGSLGFLRSLRDWTIIFSPFQYFTTMTNSLTKRLRSMQFPFNFHIREHECFATQRSWNVTYRVIFPFFFILFHKIRINCINIDFYS